MREKHKTLFFCLNQIFLLKTVFYSIGADLNWGKGEINGFLKKIISVLRFDAYFPGKWGKTKSF